MLRLQKRTIAAAPVPTVVADNSYGGHAFPALVPTISEQTRLHRKYGTQGKRKGLRLGALLSSEKSLATKANADPPTPTACP